MVERLSPHALALSTAHVGGKVGLVVGTDRTLIVDGGADPDEGAAILDQARRLGNGPLVLVYTHGHWDHVRGAAAMPEVEAFAHRAATHSVRAQLVMAARAHGARGGGVPAVTIDGAWTMDLGGVTVEVLETPGHAPGSVCLRVVEDGVLYGGDTVVTAIPPVFTDGHSTVLEATLHRLTGLDLTVLVPGHGAVIVGAAAIRDAIARRAAYIADVRDRVQSLFGTEDAEGVARALILRDRMDGPFDPGVATLEDLAARHDRMVRGLIAEAGPRPAAASAAPT